MSVYISHKRDDGIVQSVLDHLKETAVLAEGFAESFGAAEQGNLVGWAHDIGKYSNAFQNRILNNGPRVDHSTAGALECAKIGQNYAAFCVAGHHAGLPDLGTLDDVENGTLRARLKRGIAGELPDYSAWRQELELPQARLPAYVKSSSITDFFFVRMLYSCLVDADYLDTERFMLSEQEMRGNTEDMATLDLRLENYIKNWFPPKGEINEKRCAILQSCIDSRILSPGLFTLTVPTGGGKTVASLAFAIKHAREHRMKRVIYVVPYTSIIEQTAETFRHILGSGNVLEHHSGMDYQSEERVTEQSIRMSLATENWDMPIVVTTAVQFFESLFSNKSSKCRKLHNIANSVIIFDEAQMLPISHLKPCVYAIAELVKHYHVSAVLCTATQPSLERIFQKYGISYRPTELCPRELAEDAVFKRTRILREDVLPWEEIARRMNDALQILCIVNSRKNAYQLYNMLRGEGCFHLSTLMTPMDRKNCLLQIRKRLSDGLPCRVVATSLIEAGVDVDFPLVMREEAGLDSVLQAAGRCNREGKRSMNVSIVTVFRSENRPPMLFATNIGAGRIAMDTYDDPAKAEAIYLYFSELMSLKGDDALDRQRLMKQIDSRAFPFKSVAEQFRLIDNNTISIYIPFGEGADLVQRRINGEVSRTLARKLGMYSVNIYEQHFRALNEAGAVTQLGENEWYLSDLTLYNPQTGLSIKSDIGKAEFI